MHRLLSPYESWKLSCEGERRERLRFDSTVGFKIGAQNVARKNKTAQPSETLGTFLKISILVPAILPPSLGFLCVSPRTTKRSKFPVVAPTKIFDIPTASAHS